MHVPADYPNIEVVVVDDSDVSFLTTEHAASVTDNERVRYTHSPTRMTIGEKRNRVLREARGEAVLTWDDDDIYRSHRVSEQVRHSAHTATQHQNPSSPLNPIPSRHSHC